MNSKLRNGFRLGDWEVYPLRNALVGPEGEVHVEPKVMQVLERLAVNQGEVVERDRLLEDLWGGRAMSDEPLTRCVASLRHAVGDDPRDPKYIQTIPKRGYRLVCPVKPLDVRPQSLVRKHHRRLIAAAIAVVTVVWFLADLSTKAPDDEAPQLGVTGEAISETPAGSIAVLPFRNLSPTVDDDYLAEGIHADILTNLTKISALDKVISRTSMEQYRGTNKPVPVIARELAVATILEGDLQRSGDRIRINVQLINALDDSHLWAETYDRDLTATNLFATQSEISREVVSTLQIVLTDEESGRIEVAPTMSLDAYGEFVMGRSALIKPTPENLAEAEIHFRNAIALDADYALAYVGLADTLALQPEHDHRISDVPSTERRELIDKALSIDPSLGEAYTSLAFLKMKLGENKEAERYFLKSIDLSPNYADAQRWYAYLLTTRFDRNEEALPYIRKAVGLEPDTAWQRLTQARILSNLSRHDEALSVLYTAVERDPEFGRYYYEITKTLRHVGRLGEAMRWADAGIQLNPHNMHLQRYRCDLLLNLNDLDSAESCQDSVNTAFSGEDLVARIQIHFVRAEFDKAAQLTEKLASSSELSHWHQLMLAFNFLVLGDAERAEQILQELEPGLVNDDDVEVTTDNETAALVVAHVLFATGNVDRANRLFDQILDAFRDRYRDGDYEYSQAILGIYAARRDEPQLIAAFRNALDAGWRKGWHWLEYPVFDFVRDDAEWQALMTELEADLLRQRQWYEENKDEPLF